MEKGQRYSGDRIRESDNKAWEQENMALQVKADGFPEYVSYHLELAKDIRLAPVKAQIHMLFARLDAQNVLLDGIAQARAQGHDIPLFTPKPEPKIA